MHADGMGAIQWKLGEILQMMNHPGNGIAETCRRVAVELGQQVKPVKLWSWGYIHQVARGKLAPSKKLSRAIDCLYGKLMNAPTPDYETVLVVAPTGFITPNSVVIVPSRICKYTNCGRSFIPSNPSQKFCCEFCRFANRRLNRYASQID